MRYWNPRRAAAHRIAEDVLKEYGLTKVYRAAYLHSRSKPSRFRVHLFEAVPETSPNEADPIESLLLAKFANLELSSPRLYEFVLRDLERNLMRKSEKGENQ